MEYNIEIICLKNDIWVSVNHDGKCIFDYMVNSKDEVESLVEELWDMIEHFNGTPVIVDNL